MRSALFAAYVGKIEPRILPVVAVFPPVIVLCYRAIAGRVEGNRATGRLRRGLIKTIANGALDDVKTATYGLGNGVRCGGPRNAPRCKTLY
jgi:hypothetical protein